MELVRYRVHWRLARRAPCGLRAASAVRSARAAVGAGRGARRHAPRRMRTGGATSAVGARVSRDATTVVPLVRVDPAALGAWVYSRARLDSGAVCSGETRMRGAWVFRSGVRVGGLRFLAISSVKSTSS